MMKNLISLTTFLMLCIMTLAQGGVDFQHLPFNEALAKAKAEKKLVFVDCYTTWCGPCKVMTTQIFPMKEAGDFFNPRFVCVKFDMEKGEGKVLKEKLGVRVFPSFFIIRPDGNVQHCVVGSDKLDSFIKRVELGLNEKTSLLYLDQKYEKGKIKKKEMLPYISALKDAYKEEKAKEVEAELKGMLTDKERVKAEYWPLLETAEVKTPDFQFILDHVDVLEKNVGKEKIDEYLRKIYKCQLDFCIGGLGELSDLQEMKQQIEKLNISNKAFLLLQCEMAEAVLKGNTARLIGLIENNLSAFSGENMGNTLSALRAVENKASKEEFNRMAALIEKMMRNPKNEIPEEFMQEFAYHYKKLGHVGICFEDLTFEQALEQAAKYHKQIFIDCYTSWCGPCKYMSNTVFPQEKTGDYMNPKFVCVKYDMEKGEGPELAKRFGIQAYPSFVIINADGSLRHKFVGRSEADQFIGQVEEAFDDEKATGVLDAKYAEGVRDKDFLAKYVRNLNSVYSPEAVKVAGELYRQLNDEEKVSKDYWFLFATENLTPIGSEAYRYLLANREKFARNNTPEAVDERLSFRFKKKLAMIIGGQDTETTMAELNQIKKEITALKVGNEKTLLELLKIAKTHLSEK